MKKIKGFTLVELLVVIFIISILSGLVIVNMAKSRMKARDARRKADLYDVASAIEMYYSQKHIFPGDANTTYNVCSGISTDFKNDYLPKPPYDPLSKVCPNPSGTDYLYMKTDSGKYCLYAKLENTSDKDIPGDLITTCGTPEGYNYFIEK
jgi:prepilin-type N-terminal cleavage/methylation domain-containing protein